MREAAPGEFEVLLSNFPAPIAVNTFNSYASHNIAKLLVEGGSDVNAVDDFGRTPLERAQGRGLGQERTCHPEVVAYLEEIMEQQQLMEDDSLQNVYHGTTRQCSIVCEIFILLAHTATVS